MEASEATPAEATEAEAQPEATEGTDTEQPQAPDVGEALQQMNSRFDALEERLPAAEESPDLLSALTRPLEDEDYAASEEQAQPEQGEEGEDMSELQSVLNEEIRQAVAPLYMQQAISERTNAIQQFAAQHEEHFKDPEIVQELSDRLEAAGLQPDGGVPPRADHVEMAYKAYIADAAASEGETPAEAGGEGATLETGAGPGAPESELSPEEQRWADAIKGNENRSAFD